jgi:glycosyltransferase involved in cell wall biosynthesis
MKLLARHPHNKIEKFPPSSKRREVGNPGFGRTQPDSEPFQGLHILFLIPHPFFQDRGSPIADNMVLKVLAERGDLVDVVTYPEGQNVHYKNVKLYRTRAIPFVNHVRPGFSWKKLVYDALVLLKVIQLTCKKQYNLVHAVEETVFIALVLKVFSGIPYIYDMDSSLVQQMVEKYSWLKFIKPILDVFEKIAVKNAQVVVPVCQALADDIARYRPKKVVLLPDISLLKPETTPSQENLKLDLKIGNLMLMYVGNLENYQGIDLLLESLSLVIKEREAIDLAIVGGEPSDIAKYQEKVDRLGLTGKVHFLGSRPSNELANYLSQADILVSPRIKGKNTPMKIYSYLDSGKAVVATDLPTHTQVLDRHVAMLAPANPEDFARGLICTIDDPVLRLKLGIAGKMLIQQKHTYSAFRKQLNGLYDRLKYEILARPPRAIEA